MNQLNIDFYKTFYKIQPLITNKQDYEKRFTPKLS